MCSSLSKYESFVLLIVLEIFITNPCLLQAQGKSFYLRGYVKDVPGVSFVDDVKSVTSMNLVHNRLNMLYNPSSKFSAALEVRNRLFSGEILSSSENFSDQVDSKEQLIDMSVRLIDNKSLLLISEIDRLWIGFQDKGWYIKAGRQRINWGINLSWNPNDIFNTYNFFDFDYEEMPGTDALRVQYYSGLFTNFDFAVKPGRDRYKTITALRFGFNRWEYDFQMIAGIYLKDYVIGTGWAGNIFSSGFKGEISYFKPMPDTEGSIEALSLSVSCDYSFKNGLYLNSSFLYNSAAENDLDNFINLANQNLTPKYLMPAEYSFLLQGIYSFTPIVSCNMSVIYSPIVKALILYPSLFYSVTSDWDLDLIAYSFWARQDGKFRTFGNSIFLRLMFSF